MTAGRLLATDLDRTLLPNGAAEESPGAREAFAEFVRHKGLILAYVTGRRRELVEAALREYGVPEPDWILADVGSSLYARAAPGEWRPAAAWSRRLAADWGGRTGADLAALLGDQSGLELQEPAAQRPFKLSYYAALDRDEAAVREDLDAALGRAGVRAAVVYSVDPVRDVGLVDVLPAGCSKLHALEFVLADQGLTPAEAMFAGDSGNDLEVLTSGIPAVLVANAAEELRARLRAGAAATPYLARGGALGMNGNYAAGILEGWAHFHPEDAPLLQRIAAGGREGPERKEAP